MLSVGVAFTKDTVSVSCMSAGMAKAMEPVQLKDISTVIGMLASRSDAELAVSYTIAPDANRTECEKELLAAIGNAERTARVKISSHCVPLRSALLTGSGICGDKNDGVLFLSLDGDRCLLVAFKPGSFEPAYSYLKNSGDGAETQTVRGMLSIIEENFGVDISNRTQALRFMSEDNLESLMNNLRGEAGRMLAALSSSGQAEAVINITFDKLEGKQTRRVKCALNADEAELFCGEHIRIAAEAIAAFGSRWTIIADAGFDKCFWCKKAIERAAVSERYFAVREYGIGQIASKGCVLGADTESNPYVSSGLKYPIGFVVEGRYYEVLAAGSELPAAGSVRVSLNTSDMIGLSFVEKLPDRTSRMLTEILFQPENYRRGTNEINVSVSASGELISIVVSQVGTSRLVERTVMASDVGSGSVDVVFLVDYSASVREEMRSEICRHIGALADYAEENVPGVRFAAVGCGAGSFITQLFADNKNSLRNHVEYPQAMGRTTNMTEAVKNVRNIVAESRRKKVCVVFTDGCFDNPNTAFRQFRNLVEIENTELFFVHLGYTPQDILYRILGSSSQLFQIGSCGELAEKIFDV